MILIKSYLKISITFNVYLTPVIQLLVNCIR